MTHSRIERAVAYATSESLSTITRLGFSIAEPTDSGCDDPPTFPNVVDWDALQKQRVGLFPNRQRAGVAT